MPSQQGVYRERYETFAQLGQPHIASGHDAQKEQRIHSYENDGRRGGKAPDSNVPAGGTLPSRQTELEVSASLHICRKNEDVSSFPIRGCGTESLLGLAVLRRAFDLCVANSQRRPAEEPSTQKREALPNPHEAKRLPLFAEGDAFRKRFPPEPLDPPCSQHHNPDSSRHATGQTQLLSGPAPPLASDFGAGSACRSEPGASTLAKERVVETDALVGTDSAEELPDLEPLTRPLNHRIDPSHIPRPEWNGASWQKCRASWLCSFF